MLARLFLASTVAALAASSTDPSYDHQTVTYATQFAPVTQTTGSVNATLYFSPEHSTDTLVSLIQSVAPGGTIEIGTPGASSWGSGNCTYGPEGGCIGCSVDEMASEPFPIFPAVLNAIHQQGARVRLLINDYGQPTCPGMISFLDYWALNGVNISYYASTTFLHAKYMRVQTAAGYFRTSISSINWSKDSFIENREAGVVIDENTANGAALAAVAAAAFESDFNAGNQYAVTNTYSEAEMAVIMSEAAYAVVVPEPDIPGSFVTPNPYPVKVSSGAKIYASPDYARTTLMAQLASVTSHLEIYIYQITDTGIANKIIDLYNNGVNVTLLVSNDIYDDTDYKLACSCYQTISNAGIAIRAAPKYYKYSHNKFWIMDGRWVTVSTGNMSPSDAPTGSSYPPYGSASWQVVNRDYTISFDSQSLIAQARAVMYGDWANGSDWNGCY